MLEALSMMSESVERTSAASQIVAARAHCLRPIASRATRKDTCFVVVRSLLEENTEEALEHVGSQLGMPLRTGRIRRSMLRLTWMTLATMCVLGIGCKGDTKKAESRDAGISKPSSSERDAGRPRNDAASASDSGAVPDPVGKGDASKGEPPPVLTPCDLVTPSACPSDGCPAGTACVPNQCGGTECVEGRACEMDADCSTGDCHEATGRCQPETGDCTSSRDCPLGFDCEDATCVDRRIGCWSTTRKVCPLGYVCFYPGQARAFCARVFEPCERGSQCGPSSVCADQTLDGHGECVTEGPCPDTCPAGEGCGFEPSSGGREAGCYPYHVCHADTDCPKGAPKCLDAASDRPGQCAPDNGKCSTNGDCASPSICGMELLGAAPRCIGGSTEL